MPSTTQLILSLLSATVSLGLVSGSEQGEATYGLEWSEGKGNPNGWVGDGRVLAQTPQYVLDYAPLVHLHSGERYWPSMMTEHFYNTQPYLNYQPTNKRERNQTEHTLGDLNRHNGGAKIYLQSNDNIEDDPDWMTSEYGIPVPPKGDEIQQAALEATWTPVKESSWTRWHTNMFLTNKTVGPGGRSAAPAVLVVVEKEDGVVDAFWFFFYSYNLGNAVFGIRFGNHVGDWEHTTVRFINGEPKEVFLSEHANGKAYTYDAVEKLGKRPVIYSASGTHAMYARPGTQPYVLPFAILHDTTDRGPLWDPAQNFYGYHYNRTLLRGDDHNQSTTIPNPDPNDTITVSNLTPDAPTSWFYYAGHWGDKVYPSSDKRQYRAPIVGEKHYVSGPSGPRFKALGRTNICPTSQGVCIVATTVVPPWVLRALLNWAAVCIVFWIVVGLGLITRLIVRKVVRSFRARWEYWRITKKEGKIIEDPDETTALLAADSDVRSDEVTLVG